MKQQLERGAPAIEASFQPAWAQTSAPRDKLLNSASAGLVIHRVGQLKYGFRKEGIDFSLDVVRLINTAQLGYVSLFLYEELCGVFNRFHWLIHMKRPDDYRRLLDMVDHDEQMHQVSLADRLPGKGGGNWEKMFVEGSMAESVLVPQHGLFGSGQKDGHGDGEEQAATFQPPASTQTSQPAGLLLHSANSAVTVHRSVRVKYQFRNEARHAALDWAEQVNDALAGQATVFLYEETWGLQDRIHLLMHLRSPGTYFQLMRETGLGEGPRWVLAPGRGRGGTAAGHCTVIEGTLADTLLVPYQPAAALKPTSR